MSGIFEAIWGPGAGDAALLMDVPLMAALADGALTALEYDRLGRLLNDRPELQSLEWDHVIHRGRQLSLEAPLFFDARQQLQRLTDSARQRLALSFAARVVGSDQPLADEEQAVLASVAEIFEIPDGELAELIEPWLGPSVDRTELGFFRSEWNDPARRSDEGSFEALRSATDPHQRKILLYKWVGLRLLTWTEARGSLPQLARVGEQLPFGDYTFRLDGILEVGSRRWMSRILSPNEALHRTEHVVLRSLAERLPEDASVMVGHFSRLSPEDHSFSQSFEPDQIRWVPLEDPLQPRTLFPESKPRSG
ncbi:MAG: tellurite resistance TerB family protein [Myxococcota bacterium]